jgi:hypothetical protein
LKGLELLLVDSFLGVQLKEFIEVELKALVADGCSDLFRIFADIFKIQHGRTP